MEGNGPRTVLDLDQVTLVDVEFALHAHGSLKHWREVQSLDVRVSLTGGLYRLKGTRKGCPTSP
jgi:hypothetical protein